MEDTNKETSNEKVILETKVKNPNKPPVMKLNEDHASMDIAKNLIQDYTFIVTMSAVKAMFANIKNSDQLLKDLYNSWEQRMSAQLAEETKNYSDAIYKAFEDQGTVTEETSKKIKEYMDTFCRVRDKAVAMAKDGVNGINNMIFAKTKTETEKKDK